MKVVLGRGKYYKENQPRARVSTCCSRQGDQERLSEEVMSEARPEGSEEKVMQKSRVERY